MDISGYAYLFTITDRFDIKGRGLVVVPGIPFKGVPLVRRGDPLMLRTPLGQIIHTKLMEIEMVNYRPGGNRNEGTPVLLGGFHKFDIPIGTEVYLVSGE